MEPLFDFLGSYWWLIFPLGGMAGGWARSWSKASEERHRRKVELYKLKNQLAVHEQANQAEVVSLMATHDAVNHKWLDYELDVGKLIDYPLMTDVREPLTVAFLRAKKEADGLRPATPQDITTPARLAEYRAAVHSFDLLSMWPNAKPDASRTATSPGRNVKDWQRRGSCCVLQKTPLLPRQNGRRRTSVRARNGMA